MKKYLVMALMALASIDLYAHTLTKPTGPVILTVTGNINITNTERKTAEFDREMLMNLGVVEQKTMTPWSEGVDSYKGPLLRSLDGRRWRRFWYFGCDRIKRF